MRRFILLVLIFCGLNGFAQETPGEKQIEKFCKQLLKAMKSKQGPDKAFTYFLSKDDMQSFKGLYEERGHSHEFNLDTVFSYYRNNKLAHIAKAFRHGKDLGIDWSKTTFVDYSLRLTDALDIAEEGILEIYFNSAGKAYQIEIKPAYFIDGKWKVADFMFVEERE